MIRLPPCNLPAEQWVLGTLLTDPSLLSRVAFLNRDYFADPIHGVIFSAFMAAIEHPISEGFLKSVLWELPPNALAEVGGNAYIAQLAYGYVDPERLLENALAIYGTWKQRQQPPWSETDAV